MTVTELRRLYRDNALVEAIIEPAAQEGSWVLEFRHVKGGLVALTDPLGEECQYGDLDTATKSAMVVGFQQVRIESK
ncbi:hypothetical protein BCU68_12570 [Vibrio sp. 10N.286.49.B3]|uniref:hypothetical protein n=1 Tax=Vibrio sp. 10N.286.49.B3 TaxID=1880855 RepID=UPI000C85E827|nr:hypothetical protein [Vibrio sp. 10N.286.49.B3]PMH44360.1 hypothetical protein BCU68_12570 [Vibrio sp. 10N.286.49.B3]